MRFQKTVLGAAAGIAPAEVAEIEECIAAVPGTLQVQRDYNDSLATQFLARGWEPQPRLFGQLRADFRKNGVVVEVQFGNSAAVFRDLYKFDYGHTHGLLNLGVLIVPVDPPKFFAARGTSVSNMADFTFAERHFLLLALPVPILLIGLLPHEEGSHEIRHD